MYAGVSKVTSRGQITLPQKLREAEGIVEGSEVAFFKTPQGIFLISAKELDSFFDVFSARAKELGLTRKKLREEVELEKKKTLAKYFK
ncbi:TPA: AbrB/MazE/SpoVT family DNA-binding domain-containing protein [Candidatus Micrarchaeota archaeon]|nr:AbrB/MazE/SpoVT family DNA-binding domain-containing protein [Candidatus Micrarchaeota archaeon]